MTGLAALLPYFRARRRQLAAGVLAILGSAAVGLASPIVVGLAIDAFVEAPTGRTLAGYALLLVAIAAVQGVFTFSQRLILVTVSRDIENDLRNAYFAHLERMPQAYFQDRSVGDLMARGTNDLQAVRMICGPAIMYSANTLFTGLGALFFMSRIHGLLTLLALGTMPLVVLATKVLGQRVHTLFMGVQEQFSALSARVQESLAGARLVRAYAQEAAELEAFGELNAEYVARSRRLIRWTSAFHPLLQFLVGLGYVAVLWYGGTLVWGGEITVGQFVTFNFFLAKLIWPMIAIGWVTNLVQRGRASLERITDVLATEPAIRDRRPTPAAALLPIRAAAAPRGAVAFRRLTYRYREGSAPALAEVDCAVEAGGTLAVVGRTGSGKSTLLSLVPRLVEPPPGAVLVDGTDVLRLPLAELRSWIGMVPQESFLFSASVGENIALGRDGARRDELLEAARLAGLEADLERFPRGLDTLVGERGITLSGGQKQRVALARALLRRPRILILDDCLSAVDTQTEETILRNLETVFTGRTVLLVSHRISAVRKADRIVVLEGGRVAEEGTHDELLALGRLYADLARRQQLEEELAAV